jgi:hypothetical protein
LIGTPPARAEAKVFLNRKQVYANPFPRPIYAEADNVPGIALNAGLKLLVPKVVNETREWKGSIRFTDVAGEPLKEVRVLLDPEAKDQARLSSRAHGVRWRKKFPKFVHTFSHLNTHVGMRAVMRSTMNPAQDRQKVFFRAALERAMNPGAFPEGRTDPNPLVKL